MIGYLDKVTRPLFWQCLKWVDLLRHLKLHSKTFKDGDNDKNDKLMSSQINDEKLLEKYKAIWTKI